MFLQLFLNLAELIGKRLCRSLFLNKVADLRPGISFIKALRPKGFPASFVEFSRAAFYIKQLRWRLVSFYLKQKT